MVTKLDQIQTGEEESIDSKINSTDSSVSKKENTSYWNFSMKAPGFMQPKREIDVPKPEDKYFNFKIKRPSSEKLSKKANIDAVIRGVTSGVLYGMVGALIQNDYFGSCAIGAGLGFSIGDSLYNRYSLKQSAATCAITTTTTALIYSAIVGTANYFRG